MRRNQVRILASASGLIKEQGATDGQQWQDWEERRRRGQSSSDGGCKAAKLPTPLEGGPHTGHLEGEERWELGEEHLDVTWLKGGFPGVHV